MIFFFFKNYPFKKKNYPFILKISFCFKSVMNLVSSNTCASNPCGLLILDPGLSLSSGLAPLSLSLAITYYFLISNFFHNAYGLSSLGKHGM